MTKTRTYTTNEAMKLLDIPHYKFHRYRTSKKKSRYFVIAHQGTGKGNPTTYKADLLDELADKLQQVKRLEKKIQNLKG